MSGRLQSSIPGGLRRAPRQLPIQRRKKR
jgi:hypothetical protein